MIMNIPENINSYSDWKQFALGEDEKNSLLDWRKNDDSDLFHSSLLREHISRMGELMKEGNGIELISLLKESLSRHFGELNNPELYLTAYSGTKYIINEYLRMVEESIEYICDTDIENISKADKISIFEEGNRIHGTTALLLSGGAAFGIYHLGVVKALLEVDMIPDVICGSSMGAIVAACLCTKTNNEMKEMFGYPEKVHKTALRFFSPDEVRGKSSILDPLQLREHIDYNVGDYTFLEAFKKTGRTLNISVSATRKRQRPRILNHISTPNLLVRQSVMASCALPGIFPPVTLLSRNHNGEDVAYMESETWIDGSVHLDIPMQRIVRLHNVSRSIVSQANPHVLPFLGIHESRNLFSYLANSMISNLQNFTMNFLEFGVLLSDKMPWLSSLDKLRSMIDQEYKGDINIYYPMKPDDVFRIFSNPDNEEYKRYLKMGEFSTYPKIEFIRDQMRLNRVLEKCIRKLQLNGN